MHRRQFVIAAMATPLITASAVRAREAIPIADMHFHLFFMGPRPAATQPLAKNMASGGATLVSWSLVGDVPWLQATAGGFKPKGAPRAGEATSWFISEMARVKEHIFGQKLKIVRTAQDVDRALAGEPHVVLSVEGATFVDRDLAQVQAAYDQGVRHLQLVHFLINPIGDIQTERAEHGGLTDFGRQVIAMCNRLGILVDVAHCTAETVRAALDVSKVPMVWSHSSVPLEPRLGGWFAPAWQRRQLDRDTARAIAGKGGVVGLWALGADVGKTVEDYAERAEKLADWLGWEHVGFGTDMNALASPAIRTFADLRRVVELMGRQRVPEARIRNVAINNYARVLKAAMQSREA